MPGQFALQAQLRPAQVRRSPRPWPRQLGTDAPCLPRAQRRRGGRSERAGERQARNENYGLSLDSVHCRSCCSEPEAALLIAGATGASGAFVGHRARPPGPRKAAPAPPGPPESAFLSPTCPRAAVHPWQIRNDARRIWAHHAAPRPVAGAGVLGGAVPARRRPAAASRRRGGAPIEVLPPPSPARSEGRAATAAARRRRRCWRPWRVGWQPRCPCGSASRWAPSSSSQAGLVAAAATALTIQRTLDYFGVLATARSAWVLSFFCAAWCGACV